MFICCTSDYISFIQEKNKQIFKSILRPQTHNFKCTSGRRNSVSKGPEVDRHEVFEGLKEKTRVWCIKGRQKAER